VRGRELTECRILQEPELPFTARRQEPGWMITIDADAIFLNADYGALQLRTPKTEPLKTAEGGSFRPMTAAAAVELRLDKRYERHQQEQSGRQHQQTGHQIVETDVKMSFQGTAGSLSRVVSVIW
jgi:hypothetical protein